MDENQMRTSFILSVQALTWHIHVKVCFHSPQGVEKDLGRENKEIKSFITLRYLSVVLREPKLKWPSPPGPSSIKTSKNLILKDNLKQRENTAVETVHGLPVGMKGMGDNLLFFKQLLKFKLAFRMW